MNSVQDDYQLIMTFVRLKLLPIRTKIYIAQLEYLTESVTCDKQNQQELFVNRKQKGMSLQSNI